MGIGWGWESEQKLKNQNKGEGEVRATPAVSSNSVSALGTFTSAPFCTNAMDAASQDASTAPSASSAAGGGGNQQRKSNLQRIQQRKQAVRGWPQDKKIEKLAIYSSCRYGADDAEAAPSDAASGRATGCKCNGWKNPNPTPNPPRPDAPQPVASREDPCKSCAHSVRQ